MDKIWFKNYNIINKKTTMNLNNQTTKAREIGVFIAPYCKDALKRVLLEDRFKQYLRKIIHVTFLMFNLI